MLEAILVAIGLVGFGAAAWLDVKTTEFPDWLPYTMIGATITARLAFSSAILDSLLAGLLLLGFGLLLYWAKQWGDGDAWLFGALGFLLPTNVINILLVFFLLSFVYLAAYSLAVGFRNPTIFSAFKSQMRKDAKGFVSIIAAFTIAVLSLMAWLAWYVGVVISVLLPLLLFPALLALLLLFSRYGRLVEQKFFKRQISVTRLRPSDVLLDGRWRTLTEGEIEKIKARGGKVWIKEGVRFAPVFLATFVVCALIG